MHHHTERRGRMKYRIVPLVCFVALLNASPSRPDGQLPSGRATTLLGPSTIIDKHNEASLAATIERYNKHGGSIVLTPDVKKGALPVRPNENTRIIDLRYGGGVSMVRGNHPRLEGIWPQYSGLDTGLRKNLVVSDVVPFDAQVESWKGEIKRPNPESKNITQTSAEFANTHNHYQNLLSEVWGFSPNVNTVALWGDSGALYPGVKSWGGFLSARSWPVHWQRYLPTGTPAFEDENFDAALVGLEVDVLNGGLPNGDISKQVGKPLSKIGVQIVGFGKRNTAAIEIRSEDTDDAKLAADNRRGTWHYGIIAFNSLNSDSTFLFSATPVGKTGADFSLTNYSDSAVKIKSNGSKTGISFNEYKGGEIFAQGETLVLGTGSQGVSVRTPNGRELLRIGRFGLIHWNGINLLFLAIPVLAALIWLVVKNIRMSKELHAIRDLLNRRA
jgi:hypothetical protein